MDSDIQKVKTVKVIVETHSHFSPKPPLGFIPSRFYSTVFYKHMFTELPNNSICSFEEKPDRAKLSENEE